jgi:ABC-2 type transport system ATP-binding protein
MPVVEVDNICKSYDTKVAVRDLSLSIEPGGMFGLLGPNGAGKTSSIRMIIGMTMPDSGTVSLFGKPFERKALNRVGYLPEERGLYKKMKVLDQLTFFGTLHGLTASESEKRAIHWAGRMDISDALPMKTEALSKGMQQKIQFISTLLHDPDLIIMDEPFSGLDPVNTQLIEATLLEFRAQGKAIVFSTHQMHQVEKLCDTICLINNGESVLSGKVREIKSRYVRDRVLLQFEGSNSFLQSDTIASSRSFEDHVEIKLKDGADSQKLLAEAAAVARIYKFELVEPSLEEIFIQTVGGIPNA